jgi:transposase InsO family protein
MNDCLHVLSYCLLWFQIDLFDMQQTPGGPDRNYRYVLHWLDHFSKFSILRPLKDKTMLSVVSELRSIFALVGPPDILQSDNGSEFKNDMMEKLTAEKHVKHLFSRPYHPQTNGAVERANGFVKSKLRAWVLENVLPAGAPKGLDIVDHMATLPTSSCSIASPVPRKADSLT